MKNKFGILLVTWLMIGVSYIVITFTMPVIQQLSDDAVVELAATANMSNYPGSSESVALFPLVAWFIPGAIGIVTTVVVIRSN